MAAPQPIAPAGRMCGLFAIDIAAFTDQRRDEYVQLYLRDSMYRMLDQAFTGAGVRWRACRHEDRGDGVLVVLSPALPVDRLADPLPERLRGLVRVHNRVSSREARIQLRAAAHVGPVYRDAHGYAGDAVSQLFRLLDAPRFKQSLAASGGELGFIASEYLYRNVILRHATLVDPADFQPVPVPALGPDASGWAHIPAAAAQGGGSILPFDRAG
jgi:hypothetical protein